MANRRVLQKAEVMHRLELLVHDVTQSDPDDALAIIEKCAEELLSANGD